jgi:hypothetical protein
MTTKRIMIVAVGGQGNILAARILGEAAAAAGITPRMSEFHGMAQRGGVVESMVLLGEGSAIASPTAKRTSCWDSSLPKPSGRRKMRRPQRDHHQHGPSTAVYRGHWTGPLSGY